jgi:pyruvate kinase
MNNVKIICTIGPETNNPKSLKNFKRLGMDLVRLNGSHNSLAWHKKTINIIRKILPELPILFDIPGTKVRLGNFEKKPLSFGEKIILTFDKKYKGKEKFIINFQNIIKKITVNKKIYIEDGEIILKIMGKDQKDLICKSLTNGEISPNKGIMFESLKLNNKGLISSNDKRLISFVKKMDIDFLGLSFTKSDTHINRVKKLLNNNSIKIIAKIEDKSGVKNLNNILKVSDGILIDRGDLASNSNLENTTILQKQILKSSNEMSVPSIIGTGLLNSMIDNYYPSKSEVSDITNAVYDGCSAVMLSAETVNLKSAEKSIKILNKILKSSVIEKNKYKKKRKLENISHELSKFARDICNKLPITKIVAITLTGYAARIISHQDLRQNILAVTNNKKRAKSFNLIKGTEGFYVNLKFSHKSTDHIIKSLKELLISGKINNTDTILVLAVGYPKKGNKMNLMQIHKVSDLVNTFNWKKKKLY